MDPGKKSIFPGKFSKKIPFVRQFHKKIHFSRQISVKFDFYRQIFKQIRFFSGNFTKNFDFPGKNWPLILLGKLFYFSSKVTTIEHTSCT